MVVHGGSHLMVQDQGTVYAWGSGQFGQLGDGTTRDHSRPIMLTTMQNQQIAEVAAGSYHSAAINTEGILYTW